MGYGFNEPPFGRGKTLFEKPASDTTLTTADGANVEGMVWEFPDLDYSSTSDKKQRRSNLRVTCRAVRWTGTGGVCGPKDLIVLTGDLSSNGITAVGSNTAGPLGLARSSQLARVGLGSTGTLPAKCFPVDEFLPSAGVAANDICWVVIDGPAMVTTGLTELQADLGVGDPVIAMTGATSAATSTGTTSGGRLNRLNSAVSTHDDGILSRVIGVAMSACTSQGYAQNILVAVGRLK